MEKIKKTTAISVKQIDLDRIKFIQENGISLSFFLRMCIKEKYEELINLNTLKYIQKEA